MKKPTLEVTSDFTDKFNELIKSFRNDNVLVGIPATDSTRKNDEPISNAALLAINVFGSPINNIPPRDVMTSGLRNAKDQIAEQFKLCAKSALNVGIAALDIYWQRAGIIASNSVKKAINAQDWPGDAEGPSDATLKARKAEGFSGTKSLIHTGQMRNAITYVVKRGL